jgi:hypothetical protein
MPNPNDNDRFNEPKDKFLFTLIDMIKLIAIKLAQEDIAGALTFMVSLFMEIEIAENETELLKLQNDFLEKAPRILTSEYKRPGNAHKVFFKIMRYMDKTYFKGWSNARPKFSSGGEF